MYLFLYVALIVCINRSFVHLLLLLLENQMHWTLCLYTYFASVDSWNGKYDTDIRHGVDPGEQETGPPPPFKKGGGTLISMPPDLCIIILWYNAMIAFFTHVWGLYYQTRPDKVRSWIFYGIRAGTPKLCDGSTLMTTGVLWHVVKLHRSSEHWMTPSLSAIHFDF